MNEKELATKHLVAGQYFLNVAEEQEEKGAVRKQKATTVRQLNVIRKP